MRRRDFIAVLGSAAVTPRTLKAQGTDRARRIGVLMELAAGDPQARSNVAALQRGLYKLGWSQGGNLGIDYRWAPDDAVLVWRFAKELVALRPDVIVAHSSPVVATLLGQTRDIPIVFVSISDPIGEGFVASFAHPGGNVTGFTNFESSMTGKWVELLKLIAPGITSVGFLFNPQTTAGGGSYFLRPIDSAASGFKVKAAMALVHDDAEVDAAFAALAREPGAGAVLLFRAMRQQRITIPVIGGAAGYIIPDFEKGLGGFAEDVLSISTTNYDLAPALTDPFRKRFGFFMVNEAIGSAVTLDVLVQAVERAKSAKPKAVTEALNGARFEGSWTKAMPGGAVQFDQTGLNTLSVPIMVQWRKQELVTVWPKDTAKASPVWHSQ
jgi:hypothetical protein